MSELALAASLEGPPGAPVLVLGNSIGTARGLWDRQAGVLRRHFRLLRYEFRGHGGSAGPGCASPAPPGPYTIAELGMDVLALLNSRGISHAAYCGVSLGGMAGMWLAANAPERITSLAVCCSSAYLPPASLWTERAAKVRSGGMAPIAAQAVPRWFTPEFARRDPEAVAAVVAMLEATDPEGYAGCAEAIAQMDLRPMLPAISAPTLVIAATEDPATPPPHGALIARAVPGARLAVLRGTSHLANYQTPAEVTAVLLRHLLPTAGADRAP